MRRLLSFLVPFVLLPLVSAASAIVEGTVIDKATGAPIAGARVLLARNIGDEPVITKTDDRGHFEFSDLAPATHYIRAERPGYMAPGASPSSRPGPMAIDLRPPSGKSHSSCGPCGASGLKVDKSVDDTGVVRANVTLELQPYGVITGKVVSPHGTPLAGVRMQLFMKQPIQSGVRPYLRQQRLPDGQILFQVNTETLQSDDRGEFRYARLPAGTYYLRVSGGYGYDRWAPDYRATYYPGALDLESAKPIELAVGQKFRADIQVIRQAGVRVSGRLSAPPLAPASSGARIYHYLTLVPRDSLGGDPSSSAQVRDQEFQFENVLPGRYYLKAAAYERSAESFDSRDWTPLYGILREVEVGSNDVVGLDLALQPLPDIEGTVDFASGCAAVPVTLQATPVLGSWISQRPYRVDSADGRFMLRGVALGPVRLLINLPYPSSQPYWVQAMTADGRDILNRDFETPLPNGASVKIIIGCSASRSAR
jgi:hypothetical protein